VPARLDYVHRNTRATGHEAWFLPRATGIEHGNGTRPNQEGKPTQTCSGYRPTQPDLVVTPSQTKPQLPHRRTTEGTYPVPMERFRLPADYHLPAYGTPRTYLIYLPGLQTG